MKYSIVDIETTGGGIKDNKITEIAIFKHDGEKVVDEFHSLVHPEKRIPYNISRLTGITNEMVADAPRFYEIAREVLEMTRNTVFVAHNVNFDHRVLRNEYAMLGGEYRNKKLCTVKLARQAFPGLPSYSLGKLCQSLNIPLTDRHRAKGDALATVRLFEKILARDQDKSLFQQFVDLRPKRSNIPPHLKDTIVQQLPEETGVYYFRNEQGSVIYVGKALNIKKRVISHFSGSSRKEGNLCSQVADIHYEVTGSELVALLLESAEIKRLHPRFNRAQRRSSNNVKVFSYYDKDGVLRLSYGKMKEVKDPIGRFSFPIQAKRFLQELQREHELCARYCNIEKTTSICFDHHIEKCKGVCAGKESIQCYNERVKKAIKELVGKKECMALIDKGRNENERSLVLVEDGVYLGYGYINKGMDLYQMSLNTMKEFIHPLEHNRDTERIITAACKRASDVWQDEELFYRSLLPLE